jgi:hypothetical protein
MNGQLKSFDWLAFSVRVIVIAALATWLLAERVHRHDGIGAAIVVGIGYVIFPIVAYFHTRYYNTGFMVGTVVEAVRSRIARRKH